MPDLTTVGTAVVVVALVAFLLWFALGTQNNIRRGDRYLKWIESGLPLLGARTTVRWLGSSAVELKIADARPPFREAVAIVVLEPRDIGLLWAWARSRGRRDFIILRARLERSPAFEFEAGDPSGWTGADRLARLDLDSWTTIDWDGVRVAHTADADPSAMRRHWDAFAAVSSGVWRMSVRRDNPHIEVHIVPPDTDGNPAPPLFERFKELAAAVTRR